MTTEGYFTIGSGSDIACGALDAGANAIGAIQIASRHNLHTGGGIFGYRVYEGGWEEVRAPK